MAERGIGQARGALRLSERHNFLLVRLDHATITAPELADRLLRQGIAIRTFTPKQHLDERFFRIAVRTAAENARLLEALAAALAVPRPAEENRRGPPR